MKKIDYSNNYRVLEDKETKFIESLSKWFLLFCVVIAGFIFMVNIVYETAPVDGPSMQNTLNMYGDNMYDTVVVNIFMKYGNGDIVIIDRSEETGLTREFHVKRIVGMPGDVIDIVEVNGNYYLERNGEIVQEKYIKSRAGMRRTYEKYLILKKNPDFAYCFNGSKFTVPSDYVFVLGDNRAESEDSSINGPYKMSSVVGKVQYVVPYGVSTVGYIVKNIFRLPQETYKLYENVYI